MFSYVVVCGGIQAEKPPKINTFYLHRKEVSEMAVFRIEKTRDYAALMAASGLALLLPGGVSRKRSHEE